MKDYQDLLSSIDVLDNGEVFVVLKARTKFSITVVMPRKWLS